MDPVSRYLVLNSVESVSESIFIRHMPWAEGCTAVGKQGKQTVIPNEQLGTKTTSQPLLAFTSSK